LPARGDRRPNPASRDSFSCHDDNALKVAAGGARCKERRLETTS
jgi:hypothetical protein